ncbi:MAG: hypothetical protein KatS3mg038_1033 [Candidatus Kapaibacterium sp.]|nr:MAG: hypothetical protein KatS3mg038_1033 [Candidatus Kapabacteria bacterium]
MRLNPKTHPEHRIALELLTEARNRGITPQNFLLASVLSAAARDPDVSQGITLAREIQAQPSALARFEQILQSIHLQLQELTEMYRAGAQPRPAHSRRRSRSIPPAPHAEDEEDELSPVEELYLRDLMQNTIYQGSDAQ